MCFRLADRPEGQHRGCRGGLRFSGSGNRNGADGGDYCFRTAGTSSGSFKSDFPVGTGAANEMSRELGFERRGTNDYRMRVKGEEC